jgi:5-methylcytosine-specific restriction enzyme B
VSFSWTADGSLTRHFLLADIPGAVASLPMPASLVQAQAALDQLGTQYGGLAERLFGVKDGVIVEDTLMGACRAGSPFAVQLIWSSLVMADKRLAKAIETFLTTDSGKIDSTRFSRTALETFIADGRPITDSMTKQANNTLRWFEAAEILVADRSGSTVVGVDHYLPTSHTAKALADLVHDRFTLHDFVPERHVDPVDLALAMGTNRWINLTADEFRKAAYPSKPITTSARTALPPHLRELHAELYRKGQVILQGPPGTGKTYLARQFVDWFAKIGEGRLSDIVESLPSHERDPRTVAEYVASRGLTGVWDIVQFHPSMSYDDFVRSLKAEPVDGGVTFVPTHRTFGFLCEVGRHLILLGSTTEVLLIIDEINRADISKVLGELIYGLEYRGHSVTTPYTVDGSATLTVPTNLFVIGTMNTADRSIALIDYALRRRFVYLDVHPDRDAIATHPYFSPTGRAASLVLFDAVAEVFKGGGELQAIQPGHSYFLPTRNDESPALEAESISRRFAYEVVPLLQEYEAEGRFPGGTVARLLATLELSDPSALTQSTLVDNLASLIVAGTLGVPPAALGALADTSEG